MLNPYRIAVYDKAFRFRGYVGNPQSITVTPRHNHQGTGSLSVDADHRMAGALLAAGARIVVRHRPQASWEFLMSGKVTSRRGSGPALNATVTIEFADDIRVLAAARGWPVPDRPISDQSASEHDTRTGPAETVLKEFVAANIVHRLGRPVTVAADLGRGAAIPGGVAIRFQTLAEKLLPAIDAAGIGVSVRQQGAGLVLDVYEPRRYPHSLSEKGGTITDWEWSDADPTVTRAVAGGKGEGTARAFAAYADTAVEALYGDVVEGYRDATDVDTTADLVARAQQEVTDGAPRYGFSVKLSETGSFRYGENGVRVGDLVTVDIGGVTRTDVLRECTLAYSRDAGPSQTPVIGQIDNSADRKLARFLGDIRAAINRNRR